MTPPDDETLDPTPDQADPDGPPFGAADMADFLGLPRPVFQHWMNSGIAPHEVITRGGRTYRRFGFRELAELATIRALHRQGLELMKCKKIAEMADEALAQVNQVYGRAKMQKLVDSAADVFWPSFLAVAGEQWAVYGPAATLRTIADDLGNAEGILVLNMDAIEREVMRVWGEARNKIKADTEAR